MLFEQIHLHPRIQAVVWNTYIKAPLECACNQSGQPYDIQPIGDLPSSYSVNTVLNSELAEDALARHLKWGTEEDFWAYEYNFRSSCASALHMKLRIAMGVPGADKREEDLTEEERDGIEKLEHCRWNAYMRSDGFIYSGSKDKASRNNLAKMHNNLVSFDELTEEVKRLDSIVGTK